MLSSRALITFCFGACVAFRTSAGQAGCPTLCNIEMASVIGTPPLPSCVASSPASSGCLCSFDLTLTNRCTEPLLALDFQFDRCADHEPHFDPPGIDGINDTFYCTSLAKGRFGRIGFELHAADGPGPKERQLLVRSGDAEHTVVLKTTVNSFAEEGGCTVPRSPTRGQSARGLLVYTAALTLSMLRRRRELPRRNR
jgi:hypothetical protein